MLIIPDGVYKLHNDQDLNLVADLITGGPGPIDGIMHWKAHNDKWLIKNVEQGADSNEFTIESVGVPGIYAYAEQKEGAPVVGSPHTHPIVWTLTGGWWGIQYPNSTLVWELPNPNQNIILVPYNGQENTKWGFKPIGN